MNPITQKTQRTQKTQILWITQTAMLLAIALISQIYLSNLLSFNTVASQLAVGSTVNLCLILATVTCGFFSGFSIAFCTPFIAFISGRIVYPQQVFIAALGNTAIIFIFWLVYRKKIFGASLNDSVNWTIASIIGAVAKFLVLWLGMTKIFINLVLMNDETLTAQKIEQMTAVITLNFTWTQLVTASMGGILSFAVYRVLKNVLFEKPFKIKN